MDSVPRFLRKRWALAAVFCTTLVVMANFEIAKQAFDPGISLWESHIATIIFTSVIAVIIAFFPLRAMQEGHRKAAEELERRKSAEERLKHSEAQYRSFVDSTENSIYTVDPRGRYLMMNRQHKKRLGISGACEGHPYSEFHTPAETDRFSRLVDHVVADNIRLQDEYEEDGRTYLRQLNPVADSATGSVLAVTIVSNDITDQKRSERAIVEANRKLNLMSEVTRHDILNQLLVLSGYLDLVRNLSSDPKATDYLDRCNDAIRTIRTQISFTRDYQNIGVLAPEWQSVPGIISRVQQGFLLTDVIVTTDCTGLEVYADPLLEKVFYNLLDNALRYGGGISEVRVTCARSGRGLVIACEDNGIGIPADMKERIFQKGYGKNTGLGLFLAREILSITGLTIEETGEEGSGARFEITVPEVAFRFSAGHS